MLKLYSVSTLAINGKILFKKRDKVVKDFYDDKLPGRVLIFSNVGSVGLNLSIADVIIFFVNAFYMNLTFFISFYKTNCGQLRMSVRSEDESIINSKRRPSSK